MDRAFYLVIAVYWAVVFLVPGVTAYYLIGEGKLTLHAPEIPVWLQVVLLGAAGTLLAIGVTSIFSLLFGRRDYKELADKLDALPTKLAIAMRDVQPSQTFDYDKFAEAMVKAIDRANEKKKDAR